MTADTAADALRRIPGWLQALLAAMIVTTFLSGWATTAIVWLDFRETEGRVEHLTTKIEATADETRRLGLCLVEQFSEHRTDNRGSHEALADAHRRVPELPAPPSALPAPREEMEGRMVAACDPYLELRTEAHDGWSP